MRALSRDTSSAATQVQVEILRGMTPGQRLGLATRMSDDARALSAAGIRHRHPEYSADEVRSALLDVMLGADLAAHVRIR